MVDKGAVDGISVQRVYAVDGFTLEENRQTLERLHTSLADEEVPLLKEDDVGTPQRLTRRQLRAHAYRRSSKFKAVPTVKALDTAEVGC